MKTIYSQRTTSQKVQIILKGIPSETQAGPKTTRQHLNIRWGPYLQSCLYEGSKNFETFPTKNFDPAAQNVMAQDLMPKCGWHPILGMPPTFGHKVLCHNILCRRVKIFSWKCLKILGTFIYGDLTWENYIYNFRGPRQYLRWAISGQDLGQISPIIWTPPFYGIQ